MDRARDAAQGLRRLPPLAAIRRALHSLVLPWRKRIDANLRVRLVFPDGDSADLVLRGTSSEISSSEGAAEVTITTTAAALARSRQHAVARLDAQVSGRVAHRRQAFDVLGLKVSPQ